jgi:uncharacterized protein YuzE
MAVNIGPHAFDHVKYDARRDVLYLSIGEPRAASDSLVTPEGHVLRYDESGDLIGATLINAKWLTEQGGPLTISLAIPVDDLEPAFAVA